MLRDAERGGALSQFFAGAGATYVVQDELFVDGVFGQDTVLLDDARHEVDTAVLNAAVERIHGYRPSFRCYHDIRGIDQRMQVGRGISARRSSCAGRAMGKGWSDRRA